MTLWFWLLILLALAGSIAGLVHKWRLDSEIARGLKEFLGEE